MNKPLNTLLFVCLTAVSAWSIADDGMMNKDGMTKDAMSNKAMAKDGMSKDGMAK